MGEATEELADRVRNLIGHRPGVTQKKMFGGYGFMLNGNMVCAAMSSGNLMLRVGPDLHNEALSRPGAQAMHHNGRDWIGFIEVTDDIEHDEGLGDWVTFAWNFVATLPPKIEKPAAKKAAAPKQAARTRRTARPD